MVQLGIYRAWYMLEPNECYNHQLCMYEAFKNHCILHCSLIELTHLLHYKIKVMQGRTCLKYRNKVGLKGTLGYPATKHSEKERQGLLLFCCATHFCNRCMCGVVFLVFLFFWYVQQQGSLAFFRPHFVCILLTGLCLHYSTDLMQGIMHTRFNCVRLQR